MLSTGEGDFIGLFSYVLILGCGVLGISYRKNWHLLNYLSFVGTYGLFFAMLERYYDQTYFWHVMPFLIAFFVLYSTIVFFFNLVNRKKSTLLELLGLLINAGIFFITSYVLIEEIYGKEWVAAVTLGLAAFYVLHIYYFLVRKVLDRELLLSFTALASLLPGGDRAADPFRRMDHRLLGRSGVRDALDRRKTQQPVPPSGRLPALLDRAGTLLLRRFAQPVWPRRRMG